MNQIDSRTVLLIASFILTAFMPVLGQMVNVTTGKFTYRPVVKNGRIMWFESLDPTRNTGRARVFVYENGKYTTVTSDASVSFPGWPDIDEDGNVAYMKNVGTSHQVFVYDPNAKREIQITNNPAIDNSSISMGLGSAKVYTGFARISDGDVVFRDQAGHIYLYEGRNKLIRKITTDVGHVANLGDDDDNKGSTGVSVPLNGHVKYFEFDGEHIVWMHEERTAGTNAKVTIYMARSIEGFVPKQIASFDAWVPNDNTVLPGKLWNPYFEMCNGSVVWQYVPVASGPLPRGLPTSFGGNLDDMRVGFYENGVVKEISRGTAVQPQSVRILAGKVSWWQVRKKTEGRSVAKFHEVVTFGSGGTQTVASYPEPPKQANLTDTFWDSVTDVEIVGDDVLWTMTQVECFQQFKMPLTNEPYCMYKPTNQIGFFLASSGTSEPFRQMTKEMFAGGGELDRGLYAFFSVPSPAVRDISALNIQGGPIGTARDAVTVTDLKQPNLRKWKVDEKERKQVSDAFSISYDAVAGCSTAAVRDELTLESVTLDVSAQSSPTARMEDIQSVALYSDEDGNGQLDIGTDKLLGRRSLPSAEIVFTFSGDGIKIRKNIPKYFLVEIAIKDDVCPCGKYSVTVAGEKLGFRKSDGEIKGSGRSTGGFQMPEAEIKEFSGDEQSDLPGRRLPEKLAVVFRNFPIRCGKIRFQNTSKPRGLAAWLSDGSRNSNVELLVTPTQIGRDARGEISLELGPFPGLYTLTASIEMEGNTVCNNEQHFFREHAGKMIVQTLDMNNPDFYTAIADTSNPEFDTWKTTMTSDVNKLSKGGEGRNAVIADGASMLLIRAKLLGFTEPPEGDVNFSFTFGSNVGHLSRGLGEQIPAYNGGTSVSAKWVKAGGGIYAFALYTPPKDFGYVQKQLQVPANHREFRLNVTYDPGGSRERLEWQQFFKLYKPSTMLIHGLWSGPATWGPHFTENSWGIDAHTVDYSHLNTRSFAELGVELDLAIRKVIRRLRQGKIAATKVNVVGHSMGGLVTRQFIADDHGRRHFRKDNFGKGDIYKFVTIGTPHFGSPLAWMLVNLRDERTGAFRLLLSELGIRHMVDGGAIDAMCPGSKDLRGLGATNVPSHTVRTWNFDSQTSFDENQVILEIIRTIGDPKKLRRLTPLGLSLTALRFAAVKGSSVKIHDLYTGDKTDMLVTLFSQSGGIAQGGNSIIDKHIHFETGFDLAPRLYSQTISQQVAAYVYDLLNHDHDDINVFAPRLPPPDVQDQGKVCVQKP